MISRNDAIIQPYKTYDLFFEITFHVLQKLGAYEDIGTPEEFAELKEYKDKTEMQWLDDMGNLMEPLKLSSALRSEILKYDLRKAKDPERISVLDLTVIAALKHCLDDVMKDWKRSNDGE